MKEVTGIYQSKVDEQTIEMLEELLSKAKTGELRSLVFVDLYHDGQVKHGWSGRPTIEMMGELEHVKFDFFSQMYFPVIDE